MTRTFGIEIEIGGSPEKIHDEFRRSGIPVQRLHSHLGWDRDRWTIKRDGSLGYGDNAEVVSGILNFDDEDDRTAVNHAVAAMQRAGCKTIPQGGIHVHVGASDLNPRQVAAVGRFFYKFEDQLYRIASSGWEEIRDCAMSDYAPPMSNDKAQRLGRARDMNGFLTAWYGSVSAGQYAATDHHNGQRYCGLNLHAWNLETKTIEFRLFNTSLNPKRIQAYIALCVAIVEDARQGFARSIGKQFRLGGMAEGRISESAAIIRLQQVLTTDSSDTKRVMSKQDWKLIRMCWKDSKPQRAISEYRRAG